MADIALRLQRSQPNRPFHGRVISRKGLYVVDYLSQMLNNSIPPTGSGGAFTPSVTPLGIGMAGGGSTSNAYYPTGSATVSDAPVGEGDWTQFYYFHNIVDKTDNYEYIGAFYGGEGPRSVAIRHLAHGGGVAFYDGTTTFGAGIPASAEGTHFIVVTHTDGKIKFYVDWGYSEISLTRPTISAAVILANAYLPGQGYCCTSKTVHYISGGELRAWSDDEVLEFMGNPWGFLYEPETSLFEIPEIFYPDPPQLAVAEADISTGTWVPSIGTELYPMLLAPYPDEYISATAATACEIQLSEVINPNVKTGHVVRYQLLSGYGYIMVRVRCGSTLVAEFGPHKLTLISQYFEHTLTQEQASLISDYSNLRVSFEVLP